MLSLLAAVMTGVLVFFLALNTFRALLLLYAVPELWSHWRLADDAYFRTLIGSDALPPVSVVTTAYNEEEEVIRRVRALLELEYPRHEVVLVNDGSTDGTMRALVETFELTKVSPAFTISIPTRPVVGYYRSSTQARLLVIDKERGGTADALNAGVNATRYPYTLVSAGNNVFARDVLLRLTSPFLLNQAVCAVTAPLRVADGGHPVNGRFIPAVWGGVQVVESLRTCLFERLGWNRIASNMIFPGGVGLFRREHLMAIRGGRADVLTPGIDLGVRLQRHLTDHGINALMLAVPDPVAWTVPRRCSSLAASQALRQRGLFRVLREHRDVCLNPEYGAFGVIALPYYWAAYVIAPVLELLGYLGLMAGVMAGAFSGSFVLAYLAAVLGYGMLLSVWAVVLEALTGNRHARGTELLRLLLYAIAEPFGYRQTIAWYRSRAFWTRTARPGRSARTSSVPAH